MLLRRESITGYFTSQERSANRAAQRSPLASTQTGTMTVSLAIERQPLPGLAVGNWAARIAGLPARDRRQLLKSSASRGFRFGGREGDGPREFRPDRQTFRRSLVGRGDESP